MAKILLLLLVVVVGVVFVIRMQANAYERFMANAAEVMGAIDKKETRIDEPKTKRTENILLYSYMVNGTRYSGEEKVEYPDLWQEAREGMELKIYYAKNNPAKAYPAVLIDRRLDIANKTK